MERRSSHFADSQRILLSWHQNSAIYRRLGNVADLESDSLSVLTDLAIQVGTPVTLSRLSFLDFGYGGVVHRLSRLSDRYVIGIGFTPHNTVPSRLVQFERWAA